MAATPVVVDAVRTPVGRGDGALADIHPEDLVTTVLDALVDRTGVAPESWTDLRLGCANQEDEQGRNLARQSLLAGGYPESVPGATTSRLCGSSLTTLVDAARAVEAGDADCVVAAGVESMSRVPFSDWVHPAIEARYGDADRLQMGQTAERIARREGIGRERQDAFACRSHERAVDARDRGRFDDELVPVDDDRGSLAHDECVRPDTSREALADLDPVFRDDDAATVTAGNAAPVSDGAAGLLVTSEAFARELGLDPLARVDARAVVGVDPKVMGVGPVPATRAALSTVDYGVDDVDLVELNEAFAAQSLYCVDELGLDPDRTNVNGGAIALGHPLGCSGARIATTLCHELRRRDGDRGLATMCVGFGQGVAVTVERV